MKWVGHLFSKKQSSCCDVKIEEVKDKPASCCDSQKQK
ncbi:hypothetical protein PASE110613_14700 [Paenibacillus sediminis]|uniref:Uncharacterized protein n=1 Tax=Paenibacillus sediminis TaxID=664909 RepID=A0ABS4H679_9BACL|nr:hypothetical protein [Paenibacillus sediminis]